ncbi:hypothetical protein [Oerskovia flava]|uniref:hypothetical protein n=1 Tax=Oerskovia flava TaxID=2986422 RepID=UPI00223F7059|nr:hypothetical protein [Oerskovia sp. JB1-3-2]
MASDHDHRPAARRARRDGRPEPSALHEPPAALTALAADRAWILRRPRTLAPRTPWVVVTPEEETYDVTLLTAPPSDDARARLAERLDLLRSVDHEHMAGVHEILQVDATTLAVLTAHVPGLRLDELAGARGPFLAGEAVTVLVPVAQALAAMHHAGLVHGVVRGEDVTVSDDGRPVLHPALTPFTGDRTGDVHTLARLLADLLPAPSTVLAAGGSPSAAAPASGAPTEELGELAALHGELALALREDPRTRPEIGTFAARCFEAVPARPVALPDAARLVSSALAARRVGPRAPRPGTPRPGTPRPDTPRSDGLPTSDPSRPRTASGPVARPSTRAAARRAQVSRRPGALRPVLSAAGVLVGCTALVLVFLHLGPADAPSGPTDPAPGAVATVTGPVVTGPADLSDPAADAGAPLDAAAALTVRRVELLAGGDGDLESVVLAGSPAHTADEALLGDLRSGGTVLVGAGVEVLDTRLVVDATESAEPTEPADVADVAVEVDYTISAHRQRSADGQEVEVPEAPATTAVLVLRWTDDGWRVAEVR